jgi:hypothetical protein
LSYTDEHHVAAVDGRYYFPANACYTDARVDEGLPVYYYLVYYASPINNTRCSQKIHTQTACDKSAPNYRKTETYDQDGDFASVGNHPHRYYTTGNTSWGKTDSGQEITGTLGLPCPSIDNDVNKDYICSVKSKKPSLWVPTDQDVADLDAHCSPLCEAYNSKSLSSSSGAYAQALAKATENMFVATGKSLANVTATIAIFNQIAAAGMNSSWFG